MLWTFILSSSEPDVIDRYMLMTLRSVKRGYVSWAEEDTSGGHYM